MGKIRGNMRKLKSKACSVGWQDKYGTGKANGVVYEWLRTTIVKQMNHLPTELNVFVDAGCNPHGNNGIVPGADEHQWQTQGHTQEGQSPEGMRRTSHACLLLDVWASRDISHISPKGSYIFNVTLLNQCHRGRSVAIKTLIQVVLGLRLSKAKHFAIWTNATKTRIVY